MGDQAARDGRPDRVQLELEGRDDAEVASGPAQSPEEVGVLVLTRRQNLPVGGDHSGGDKVVERKAELRHQPAEATSQGEPGDSGRRDDAAGGRHGPRPSGSQLGRAQP